MTRTLSLNRETLRRLDGLALGRVLGAADIETHTCDCPTFDCSVTCDSVQVCPYTVTVGSGKPTCNCHPD